jgi:hypothetical protein
MAAADEQYGNKGYGQIGSYGGNPYDSRDQSPAGYNNYDQGGYGMSLDVLHPQQVSNTVQAM